MTDIEPAGTDSQDRSMLIAQVELFPEQTEGVRPGRKRCLPIEYWLVYLDKEQRVVEQQQVLLLCNDGYGKDGQGTDLVNVRPNQLIYTSEGGDGWQWSRTRALQLSPLRLSWEEARGWWAPGQAFYSRRWSWEELAGSAIRYTPWCFRGAEPSAEAARAVGYRYLVLPRAPLTSDMLAVTWITTSLGACAAGMDSSGARGFILEGEPSQADDAALKMVLGSERVLLVEVQDDQWSTEGKTMAGVDHLELWIGPDVPLQAECVPPLVAPRQWLIPVQEGEVEPGFGEPAEPPQVERVPLVIRGGRTMMRMKIVFPRPVQAITVAYNDSDDGKARERLLATSTLIPGVAASLGRVQHVDPRIVMCAPRRDTLVLKPQPYYPVTAAATSAGR